MGRYREIDRTVDIVSFDELVAIGIASGAKLDESGMPTRFKYSWRPVTIMSPNTYIVVAEHGTIHLNRGESLVTGRNAEIYAIRDEKVRLSFEAVTA